MRVRIPSPLLYILGDQLVIEVATDGSSLGNPGDSAWAWYVTDNRWRSGFIGRGTNNKAELMAIRDPLYREIADIIIETDERPPRMVVQEIIERLRALPPR